MCILCTSSSKCTQKCIFYFVQCSEVKTSVRVEWPFFVKKKTMCVCMYVAFILGIDFGKKIRKKEENKGEEEKRS